MEEKFYGGDILQRSLGYYGVNVFLEEFLINDLLSKEQ